MPKKIDKDALRNVILGQKDTYTVQKIIAESDVSSPTVWSMIKELTEEGLVRMDSKDGHRMVFVTVGKAGQAKTKNGTNMMSLTPAERFKYVGDCTDMVIQNFTPSLLVTGLSGIGKTWLVRKRLEMADKVEGNDYHFIQGHSSPLGLYMTLYDHMNDTIVFDDCDTVFKDGSVNTLKCALDSYATRKVCWQTSRLPEGYDSSFNFKGQIIFISNMDSSKIDEAVKSRTIVIDLQMTRKEIVTYIESILNTVEADMSMAHKIEVLAFMKDICDTLDQFNIRTFIKACRIRRMADRNGNDWKKMIMVLN